MLTERVLSLDISSKTGWACLVSHEDSFELEQCGTIPQVHEPEGVYPYNFVDWAYKCFTEIVKLIDRFAPDVLVIEETTAGSKAIYTQKILEWVHFLLAKLIKDTKIKAIYLMTEQWRRETGCQMTKEELNHNKKVREYKDKHNTKIAYNAEGKRVGKIGRKHVNIRRANEIFGQFLPNLLRKKDEDTADALMLAYCYHLRKLRSNV
jgi:Holliday junction resolvasome RuvABC endonuclease subunit